MDYSKIREAAEARVTSDSTGAWGLADTLAAAFPAGTGHGGDRRSSSFNSNDVVTVELATTAENLSRDGIETPAGNSYTAEVLRQLRLVALGWPSNVRRREAAFRTHQEAGTADEWKRSVLIALCEAARTRKWDQPEGLGVDETAWASAVVSVKQRTERGNRYKVAANDLRTALKRKTNVPDTDPVIDEATMPDVLGILMRIGRDQEFVAKVLCREDLDVEGHARQAALGYNERNRTGTEWIETLLTQDGDKDRLLEQMIGTE